MSYNTVIGIFLVVLVNCLVFIGITPTADLKNVKKEVLLQNEIIIKKESKIVSCDTENLTYCSEYLLTFKDSIKKVDYQTYLNSKEGQKVTLYVLKTELKNSTIFLFFLTCFSLIGLLVLVLAESDIQDSRKYYR